MTPASAHFGRKTAVSANVLYLHVGKHATSNQHDKEYNRLDLYTAPHIEPATVGQEFAQQWNGYLRKHKREKTGKDEHAGNLGRKKTEKPLTLLAEKTAQSHLAAAHAELLKSEAQKTEYG